MKVMITKDAKSANGVSLQVDRYNMSMWGYKAGEVVVRAVTKGNAEWAEVARFRGTMAEGVAYAKGATVVITGVREAHVS